MNKHVIVNVRSNTPIRIMESRTEGSDLYLVGEFTTFDVVNRNKRIYKKENYKTVLEQISEKCLSGALMGELGHPNGRNMTDLTMVSHVVTKLEIDDENNCVRGELKLLDTPNGRIARTLVESGVPLFVSSRATGYITKGGVVTLTNLITYDLVDEPGFANARLSVKDITESLCSECDDIENVAIFDTESGCPVDATVAGAADQPVAPTTAEPAAPVDDRQDLINAINALSSTVQSLENRIANIEASQVKTVPAIDTTAIAPAISQIVDAKVAESKDEILKTMYDLDERRIEKGVNKPVDESMSDIVRYLNYVAEEVNKHENCMNYITKKAKDHEQYMNYIAEEANKHEKYMNYVAEQHNAEMGKVASYLDYVAENFNNGDIDAPNALSDNDHKRIEVIESYLENMGLEFNKNEKIVNEKMGKFVEYVDYIANTINENNREVELLQQYINEEVVNTLEGVINENKEYRKEFISNIKEFNKLNKSVNSLDTRIGNFNDAVNERLNAMSVVSDSSSMTDVKKLLEDIRTRENTVKQAKATEANAQKENLFLEREEKRLLSFMHPSVKHIWESFDNATKLKIATDMSVSKCLAIQSQSLILTRMIHNYK